MKLSRPNLNLTFGSFQEREEISQEVGRGQESPLHDSWRRRRQDDMSVITWKQSLEVHQVTDLKQVQCWSTAVLCFILVSYLRIIIFLQFVLNFLKLKAMSFLHIFHNRYPGVWSRTSLEASHWSRLGTLESSLGLGLLVVMDLS